MLKRHYNNLLDLCNRRQVLIIYGARRTGKTTILNEFIKSVNMKLRFDTGDNITIRNLLGEGDFQEILNYTSGYELILIDEAQEIPNIGKALKLIADHTDTTVIVTGSSSFQISQTVGEPLTGRKVTVTLYPMSQMELNLEYNRYELKEHLNEYLLFGLYPEVVTADNKSEKIQILQELVDSYLLKDILSHERIKSPKVLVQIVKLLAFQIGSEVSLNELSTKVSMDIKTVGRYLDLLEKCFVIFKLRPFSSNLRKELTSKCKYYFWDTGVRNALISQFAPLEERVDAGSLFENFIITERFKKLRYQNYYGSLYFWRHYNGQEIDLIEEADGKMTAIEIKFSSKKKPGIPSMWKQGYPDSEYRIINSDNYIDFLIIALAITANFIYTKDIGIEGCLLVRGKG